MLVKEVSLFLLIKKKGEISKDKFVYMVYEGFCGVYRNVWIEEKQKYRKKFLLDAKKKIPTVS